MRIAITGASGLVGANLAAVALAAGHEVVCTKRAGSRVAHLAELAIRWEEADLADADALARAFEGAALVAHSAAHVEAGKRVSDAMRATNVGGTRNVLDACRRAGVARLVHVSTVAAIGVSDGTEDVTEDWPFNFAEHGLLDGYTETKREAQDVVASEARGGAIDAVIVNPTLMFGPYDARPSSGQFVVDVARGKAAVGSPGSQNIVDVRDVARGILLAAERGARGEMYILGGENVSYHELFTRIARLGGWRAPLFVAPRALAAPLGWVGDLRAAMGGDPLITSQTIAWAYCRGFCFSSAKAMRDLGYAPGPAADGIRGCIDWLRATGKIA